MHKKAMLILTALIIIILAIVPASFVSADNIDPDNTTSKISGKNLQTQPSFSQSASPEFVGDSPEDEAVSILSSTLEGITFEINVPWEELVLEPVSIDGREYTQISLNDWPLESTPGAPVLPFLNEQLGIPFDAEITINVIPGATRSTSLSFPILPGQEQVMNWAPPTDEFSPDLPEPVFIIQENATIYGSNALYPSDLVRVSSDGVLREQRVLGLSIYPVQYQPEKQELTIYETLQIEVTYGGTKRVPTKGQIADSEAYEDVFQSGLLNYEIAEQFRQSEEISELKTMSLTEGETLPYAPPEPGWRIKVREDGMYRLTYDELSIAGLLDGNPDPRTFKMFNRGSEIAIQVVGEEDGTFDSGDMILFFGQAYATKYTLDNIYWLTYDPLGVDQGTRMQEVDATPTVGTTPLTYSAQQHNEKNLYYFSQMPGDDDVDRWLYNTYIYAPSYTSDWTNTFSLPASFTGSASLTLSMVGYLDIAGVIDHHVKIYLNNIEVGDAMWDGVNIHIAELVVPDGILHTGDNTLKVSWVNDTGVGSEVIYFDWYELDYQCEFIAQNNSITFNYSEPGIHDYLIREFTTDQLRIFDVTNPSMVEELIGEVLADDAGYLLSFQDEISGLTNYRVFTDGQFSTVESIDEDTPSNLRSITNGADYIVITHADFIEQAVRLADYRAGRLVGQIPENILNSMVVDVQDIYDEFNFGLTGAAPIREFLAYAYNSWEGQQTAPSYVVLMGDGNRDPNNYQNYGRKSYIPPYLAAVDPWIKETAADNQYVTLTGEDNIPDMMLGRMAVNTNIEAEIIVDKVINYELSPPPGDWQQTVLSVADNADIAGNFPSISDSLISCCQPAPYNAEKVYYGTTHITIGEAQNAIISEINIGKIFVNYNGHGAINSWAGEKLFSTKSMTSLVNGSKLPVVISMACRDGYYHNQYPYSMDGEALAEVLVRGDNKGALASWSATGLGVASGHDHLSRGFYSALFFNNATTLGEATTAGKLRLWSTGGNLDLLDTYLLFGDPAQVIPITQPLSISGQVLDDTGNPIADVAVYDDTGHFALSDTDGYYTITGTPVGDFTLTPYKPGYAFTPDTHNGTLTDTDITGKDFTGTLVPVFTISGYAKDSYNNPIVGVLITDDKGHSTYTNDQGYYEITELFLGSHTLSAAKDHHLISPLEQTVEIVDSDLTLVNFVTDPLYALSGTITDGSSNPIPNITVDNGQGLTTQTDSAGTFTFPDLVAGSYNVIPSRIGYVFEPASMGIEIRTYDVTGVDFTAALDPIFSISGTIADGAVPLAGVTVSDGAGHSTLTDDTGAYSITGLTLGSYTLTPEKADYIFDPVTLSPEIVDADLTGIDFTAIPVYTISGMVKDAFDVPVPGVTITDNLVGATAVTDAAGTYTLTTLPANTYTLTADKTGDTFFPSSPGLNIVTVGPSTSGIDFIMNNRVPGVTSTSPAYAGVDDLPFTLFINGQDFVQGAIVRWNGTDRTTTTIDSQHLSIDLTAIDLETAGVNTITVFNPEPGGGESASNVSFPVIAHTPVVGEFMLTNKVIFDWDDFSGATLYNIQMSLSSTFSGVVFNVNTASSNYTYGGTLINSRTYYWRIRPQEVGSWGEWSQTWQFNSLIQNAPVDDTITSDTTPYFSWYGYPGATGYTFEIIPEDVPDNPATSTLSVSLPTVTGYTIPNVSALDHGRYLWRLQVFTASSALTTPWRPLSILPPAPALLAPANNAFATSRTPELSWEPVPGVTGYQLIVDNNGDFRTPEYPEVTLPDTDSAHTLLSSLPSDTRYYWRMRSINLVGEGPWSPTYSFIVDTVFPAIPSLYRPDDTSFTPDTTPSLSVFGVSGANRYNFQLSASSDFSAPLFDQTLSSTTFTVPNADALPYADSYFWRARSLDAAGNTSDWSDPRSFTITFQNAPAYNTATSDTTPTFTWYGVSGAYGYLLEIIPEDVPDNPATSTLSVSLPTVTNYTIPNVSALDHGRYLWRLQVFTASSALTTPWRPLSILPPAPTLLAPANNAFATSRTPELSWEPVPGVTGYQLIVDNNGDFRTPEYPEVTLPDTDSAHTLLSSLPSDTRYYWRMRSINLVGEGPWSPTYSFIIDTVFPAIPSLYRPDDTSFTPDTTPSLSVFGVSGANRYNFQLSASSDFSAPLFDQTLSSTTFTVPNADALPYADSYFWRARSLDAAGNTSDWSDPRSFTITFQNAPAYNTATSDTTPTFTWYGVSGAYGYLLEIIPEDVPDNPATSTLSVSLPTVTNYTIPNVSALDHGRYLWRLQVFTASSALTTPWRPLSILPPAPALLAPANNAFATSRTPELSWEPVPGVTGYQLIVDNNGDFRTPEYPEVTLPDTDSAHTLLSSLPSDTRYYWRMRSINLVGEGPWSPTYSFIVDTVFPAIPSLYRPDDTSFTPDTTPSLSVFGVSGANRYNFQLSASSDFSAPLFDQTLSSTTFTVPNADALPYADSYFWRARSLDAAGNTSDWSDPRSFTITFQNAPAYNTATSDTTPTFTWYGVSGAYGYLLEIIPEDVPDNPATSTLSVSLPTVTNYTIPNVSALDHGRYLWRLQVFTAASALTTPWRPLSILPPAPALLAPANNAFATSRTPELSWEPVPGVTGYQLIVDNNGDFRTPEYPEVTLPDTDSAHTLLSSLPSDTRYYWRMRSINLVGEGPWSPTYSFIVDTVFPAVPSLYRPDDTSFTPDTTPSLSVFGVSGANRYNFQLSASSDFSAPLFDQTLSSTTFTVPNADALPYADSYFWRARSLDAAGNTSDWSDPRSFTITFQNAPAYNTATSDTTPTFTWYGVSGAYGYLLEIIPEDVPDNPATSTLSVSLPTVTNYTIPNVSALDHGRYLWRLQVFTASSALTTPWRPLSILPPAPALLSPANNTLSATRTPELSWTAVQYADRYEVWVDDSAYFNSLDYQFDLIAGGDSTHVLSTSLPFDRRYYWRIRSIDFQGNPGVWSGTWSFIVDTTAPPDPALYLPANAAAVLGTPTYSWRGSSGANAYEFQYASSSDFSTIDYSSGILTSLNHRPPTQDPGTVYWRVLARDAAGNWSSGSTPRTITINLPVPAAPALDDPVNNLYTNLTPTLSWNAVDYGDTYEVQLSTNTAFTALLPVSDPTPSDLSFNPDPLPEGRFYWRARAVNASMSTGPWSGYRSFVVDTTAPSDPALYLPANAAAVLGTPTYSWRGSSGANAYEFQYASSSDFSTIDYSSGILTSLNHRPPTQDPGTVYWRVLARDAAGNWSSGSTPRTITINLPVPAAPALDDPVNNLYTNLTPTLSWNAVDYGDTYEVQLSTNTAFTALLPVSDPTPSDLSFNPDPLPEGRFYWRARAVNASMSAGPWSGYRSFVVDTTAQAVPSLYRPADISFTSDTTPSLSVFGVSGANRYNFQLSASSNFSAPLFDQTLSSTTFTIPNADALPYADDYFWRARSLDAAGNTSDWSEPRSFTITFQNAPADNTATSDTTPTFTWYGVPGALGYRLEVIPASEPGNPTSDSFAVSLPTVTGYTIPNISDLDHGSYLWRLKAFTTAGTRESPWRLLRITAPPPGLLSPANNSYVPSSTPTLSWSPIPGAARYELWVDDSYYFNSLDYQVDSINGSDSTHTLLSSLPYDRRYFWRMRSIDFLGTAGPWSPTYSFIVDTVFPTIPRLNRPADISFTSDTTPSLSVFGVSGANRYNFQLSASSDFSAPLFDQTLSSTTFTIPNADALPYADDYFWRARSLDAAGNTSDWSEPRSFTITFQNAPADNTATSDTTPTFTWYGVPGALGYRLEVIPASEPGNPTSDSFAVSLPTVTGYTIPNISDLDHGSYLWRLKAFTTAGTRESPWRLLRITAPPPGLLSPANNSYVPSSTPTLSWSPIPGAARYELWVDDSYYFNSLDYQVDSINGSDSTHTLFSSLPYDRRYFWRMRSIDFLGTAGPWSPTYSFIVDTVFPTIPRLNRPADISFTSDTTPSLSVFGVSGANRYNFQLSASSDFSAPLFDQTLSSTTFTIPNADALPYADDYFWRTRSLDAAGNTSDWSDPRSFTVTFQNAPADNTATSDTTPTFTWYGVSGALGYRLEVIPASEPGNPTSDSFAVSLPTVTGYTIPNISDLDHGSYLWRLKAFTTAGTRESPWRLLRITAPPPGLLSPANNSYVPSSTPTLSWSPIPGAARYELWVDDSYYFNSLDYQVDSINGSDSTHTLFSSLPYDRRYFWRMRSIDFLGTAGPWSPTYSFIVDTVFPAVPSLYRPADISFTSDTTPSLSVFGVSGANRYNFQLSASSDFSAPLFDQTLSSTTFTIPNADALPYADDYFWRTRSLDAAGNTSDWSDPRSFTVTFQNAPADNAATFDITPTFTWYGVPGALGYRLEVIPASEPGNPTSDSFAVSLPTVTGYTIPNISALDYGWYQWRVRVYTLTGSQYTPWRPLTVTPAPLPAPVLLNPINMVISTSNPQFSWLPVSNAAGYDIMVDDSRYFNNPEYIYTGISGSDTVHTAAESLSSGVFYWRMRTVNYLGVPGSWSAYRSFRIIL